MSNFHNCCDHFGMITLKGQEVGRVSALETSLYPDTLSKPVDLWEEARAGELEKAVGCRSATALTCSHSWPIKPFSTPSHQYTDFSFLI